MSTQSALWRKWRAQLSSRPTIPRLTAACTPTPKAAPCRLSTAAPTPARSRRQKSHPPGRRCAWRQAREPSVLKRKNKKRKKNRCGRGSRAQRRARGETAFKAIEAHLTDLSYLHANDHLGLPRHPLSSISGWARTGDSSPSNLLTTAATIVSLQPVSTHGREVVSRVKDNCFNPPRELQVPLLLHPSFSVDFCSPSLVSSPSLATSIQILKRGSLAM